MKLTPTAVIAQWQNAERTRGFMLQANGVLVAIERATPGDMWSPPVEVGTHQGGMEAFEDFLRGLTD